MKSKIWHQFKKIVKERRPKMPKRKNEKQKDVRNEMPVAKNQKIDQSEIDAQISTESTQNANIASSFVNPGVLNPSKPTNQKVYKSNEIKKSVAVIFNQNHFDNQPSRHGSQKDALDLYNLLTQRGFEVQVFQDLKKSQIAEKLAKSELSFLIKFISPLTFIFF